MRLALAFVVLLTLVGCSRVPTAWVALPVPECPGATVDLAGAGSRGVLRAHATECRSPGTGALLSAQASHAVLGAAAWRAGGPPVTLVSIAIDRSADWSEPRSLVLTAGQAADEWGGRPVVDDPLSVRSLRALATAALWVGCFFGALTLGVAGVIALVRAARRGDVVVLWWFR